MSIRPADFEPLAAADPHLAVITRSAGAGLHRDKSSARRAGAASPEMYDISPASLSFTKTCGVFAAREDANTPQVSSARTSWGI